MGFSALEAASCPHLQVESIHLAMPKTSLAMAAIWTGYSVPMADWEVGCSWFSIKAFLYKGVDDAVF